MKKRTFHKLVLFAFVPLFVACSSPSTFTYTSRSNDVKNREISADGQKTHVNVDYSRKVTATSDPQVSRAEAIEEAQFKCIQQYGIDVVVDPIYKTEFRSDRPAPYVVTVIGFAGNYVREEAPVDEFLAKNYSVEDIEKYRLLADPSFAKYYYNVPSGDVTNYYINGGEVSESRPAPAVSEPMGTIALANTLYQPEIEKKKKKDAAPEMNSKGVRPFGSKPSDKFVCGLELGYISKRYKDNGNFSSLMGRTNPAYSPGFRFGLNINPTFKYGLGLNTGLYMDFSREHVAPHEHMDISLNIPLQVSFRYEIVKKLSFMIYTGPVMDFELWYKHYYRGDNITEEIYDPADCFDLQWGIGAAIQYSRMRLKVGGEFGMIDQSDNSNSDYRQKPVYVSLAIMF